MRSSSFQYNGVGRCGAGDADDTIRVNVSISQTKEVLP